MMVGETGWEESMRLQVLPEGEVRASREWEKSEV